MCVVNRREIVTSAKKDKFLFAPPPHRFKLKLTIDNGAKKHPEGAELLLDQKQPQDQNQKIINFLKSRNTQGFNFSILKTVQPIESPPAKWLKLNKTELGVEKAKATLMDSISSPSNEIAERFIPSLFVSGASCSKLITGNKEEVDRAVQYQNTHPKLALTNQYFINEAATCDEFKTRRQYTTHYLTEEERDFPIAFSVVAFKDIEQVERLLRAIYRPQNYYCIHVDSKAQNSFYQALLAIAKCFDNVFLTSERVNVQWGWFSVLEPELLCMEELFKYRSWK